MRQHENPLNRRHDEPPAPLMSGPGTAIRAEYFGLSAIEPRGNPFILIKHEPLVLTDRFNRRTGMYFASTAHAYGRRLF